MKWLFLICAIFSFIFAGIYNSETSGIIGTIYLCAYVIIDEIHKLKSK
jgi:hypothetical protein